MIHELKTHKNKNINDSVEKGFKSYDEKNFLVLQPSLTMERFYFKGHFVSLS